MMNRIDFRSKYECLSKRVSRSLENYAVLKDCPEIKLYKAARYSLLAGGKRLRPVLSMAVCELLGGDMDDIMPYACAIEMIHTYSLIHDDLPAMDNDDFRRGNPTNHKIFGEAMAILAGDALLNRAFEVMLKHSMKMGNKPEKRFLAMDIIAEAAGERGMIGGQTVDLESEGRIIAPEMLEHMHRLKTGALIKAPVLSSAILCSADSSEYAMLDEYAAGIGLAFQIRDDILDVEGCAESMGKSTGSDAVNEKSTYVTLFGMDEAKRKLKEAIGNAVDVLTGFGRSADFLREMAAYIEKRDG
jgi:geranylgeranyl diphosphate synthase type II